VPVNRYTARLLVGGANSSIADLGHGRLIMGCLTHNSFHCTAGYVSHRRLAGSVNGEMAAHKAIKAFDLALLLRNLDRLYHHPLHFFSAHTVSPKPIKRDGPGDQPGDP